MVERREGRRVTKALAASWRAQSTAGICRVTDISAGGCFVDTITTPAVDDQTDLMVTVEGQTLWLRGTVRYIEPRIGFGLEFVGLDEPERGVISSVIGA